MPNEPSSTKGEQLDQKQNKAVEPGSKPTNEAKTRANIHVWVDTLSRVVSIFAELVPRKRPSGPVEKSPNYLDSFLKTVLPTIAFAGFGHWIGEYSVVAASISYLLAFAVVFRGFWACCNTRLKTVVLFVVGGTALLAFA